MTEGRRNKIKARVFIMFPVKLFMDDYFDPNIQKTPIPETGFQKFPVSSAVSFAR
jgi:hypothetical protein